MFENVRSLPTFQSTLEHKFKISRSSQCDHLESGEEEALEHVIGAGGDPCLWRSSRAKLWRSPPPSSDGLLPTCWLRSVGRCCMAHEAWAMGSKREDKSYVAGIEVAKADGRSEIENDGGASAACGGEGGGGGWGTSIVARWPCK